MQAIPYPDRSKVINRLHRPKLTDKFIVKDISHDFLAKKAIFDHVLSEPHPSPTLEFDTLWIAHHDTNFNADVEMTIKCLCFENLRAFQKVTSLLPNF